MAGTTVCRGTLATFFPKALAVLLAAAGGLFAVVALASGSAPRDYTVAVRTYGGWDAAGRERFDFAVWYPGGSAGAGRYRDGHFVPGTANGRILPGFYPILLLSHDAASGRFANADTAAALAAGGFIVIAPTHRGDNGNDSELLFTAEGLALRPRQLLRALDTLLGTPEFALYADESRIGVVGVGLGSLTALQLTGAAPDPSRLSGHCARFPADPFCSDWARERFLRPLPEASRTRAASEETTFFCPPLALYAPALEAAPLPPTDPEAGKGDKQESKPSPWRRLFGIKDKEKETTSAGANSTLADAGGGASRNATAPREQMVLDFQGGPEFGGTDSGAPFVHIATPDSPEFRMTVAGEPTSSLSPVPPQAKLSSPPAWRRPAEIRRIKGAALVLPAGGMLFDPGALAKVRIPVALVEAEQDGLYDPLLHAQPYFAELPVRPEVLQLKGAEHFSLFASCSSDVKAALGELCGRMDPDAQAAASELRDSFLLSFFQAVLGAPLPAAAPSGFVGASAPTEPVAPAGPPATQ